MKIEWRAIVQSVIVALLLGTLAAAMQTYVEVKMLRRDVDQLWQELNDYAQRKP